MRSDGARHDHVPVSDCAAGGALTGLISIGIGIMAMPSVLRHRSSRSPATGNRISGHDYFLHQSRRDDWPNAPHADLGAAPKLVAMVAISIWAVPGVVVGGQIGRASRRGFPRNATRACISAPYCWSSVPDSRSAAAVR